MSLAYVTMHACRTGSSGSSPSARSHTRCVSDRWSPTVERIVVDVAQVDGARPGPRLAEAVLVRLHARVEVGERLRVGHVSGHRELMVEAGLGLVEAGLQVEDRLAVLDRDDTSRGEAAAVADPVDLVEDRHERIARPEEVGVQRVHEPLRFDGAGRRHQRLAGDLAAEHPLALLVGGDTPRKRLTSIGSRSSSVTRSSRASCTLAMLRR